MEALAKISWFALALVHLVPSLVLFHPALTERLYSVPASGDVGILLTHRGALFLAVIVACLFAAFDPALRRAMACIVAISVISFLLLYVQAGLPEGNLRTIALTDGAALFPLAYVTWHAWQSA